MLLTQRSTLFLGAIAKFGKANINFITSVRRFARVGQLGSHWMDFYKV